MNRKIEFWEVSEVPDGAGGLEGTPVIKHECWGSIKPVRGLIALEYNKIYGQTGWELEIRAGRYVPGAQCIVKTEGSDYVLSSSPETLDRRFLKMHIIKK